MSDPTTPKTPERMAGAGTTSPEEQVRCALVNAGQWFRDYERQHRAKHTEDADAKAETNAGRALVCEEAAAVADALSAHPVPLGEDEGLLEEARRAFDGDDIVAMRIALSKVCHRLQSKGRPS